MDQGDKATAVRPVAADVRVKGEVREGGGWTELRFLDTGNKDGVFVEDCVQLVMGVCNTIAVECKMVPSVWGEIVRGARASLGEEGGCGVNKASEE